MKRIALIVALAMCHPTAFGQVHVSADETALLERLSRDTSFIVLNRETYSLARLNGQKLSLYEAYSKKSATTVKVYAEMPAGWEGQYTRAWFTVTSGNVTIVEAYYGDPAASGELQY